MDSSNKVKEIFGVHCLRDDVDWGRLVSGKYCPYTEKKCIKVRKSDANIVIGICTVAYSDYNGIVICPHRMLEDNQIFSNCVNLLKLHKPGNDLHILPEVNIPGGSVDFFLVSVSEDKIVDFVGIELQTLDTTGSLWSERTAFLSSKGLHFRDIDLSEKSFGINWKMSAKTILMQILHKAQTFEYLNKHLVLVIQDCFWNYMNHTFNFSKMKTSDNNDSFHIHYYNLQKKSDTSFRLSLDNMVSTDTNGFATCLQLKADANIKFKMIVDPLEKRISKKTLLAKY
ncbi:MAG: hypothetical protein LBR80_04535 [Deltaproteobacteria bacterium]|jgi:hypothetical protein|nr:hypothetical protein [Deltaproteobacteria bacterium]